MVMVDESRTINRLLAYAGCPVRAEPGHSRTKTFRDIERWLDNQPEYRIDEVASRRAERDNDSTKWAPRDALAEALRDVDSGEVDMRRVLILYEERDGDGFKLRHYAAGVDRYQSLSMVVLTQRQMEDEWRAG